MIHDNATANSRTEGPPPLPPPPTPSTSYVIQQQQQQQQQPTAVALPEEYRPPQQSSSSSMPPLSSSQQPQPTSSLSRWYPRFKGRPLYRGNQEALGWAFDVGARSIQFIGAGAFLSTALLRLATEAAGCDVVVDDEEEEECTNTVYGIRPSSLLTTYTMVVGVASSAMLPLLGAIVDYTSHRLLVGRVFSVLYTICILPTIFLNSETWFVVAIVQVVVSFLGWAQTSVTYAYLPELTNDEILLGQWTMSFTIIQFVSMVVYLAAIIGSVSLAGKGDDDLLTSQVAMAVAFVANAVILPISWCKLFQQRQPLHQLPADKSLWTIGFVQLWQTSKHIVNNYRALKWFYIAVAFSDAGIQALATVAITYLTDQLQFTARENGFAILLMLCGSIPGAVISNFCSRKFDPIKSSMLSLVLLITATAFFAAFTTGPGQYVRTYFLAFVWGIGVGWNWTCGRLAASSVIPEGQDTELMGIFLFAGQCLSWIPPLVFTAMNEAGISQRIGVATLDVYLLISLLCYCFMGSYKKAREEVNRTTVFTAADSHRHDKTKPTTTTGETSVKNTFLPIESSDVEMLKKEDSKM